MFTPKIFADEGSTYSFGWLDKDKEVYVLQNREFRKVQTFNFNLAYGLSLSEAFVDETAIQGRIGYYFWEFLGLEILYSKNDGKPNSNFTGITGGYGTGSGGPGSVPFYQIIDDYTGIIVNWSPFYSKINLFNGIVYLDWTFGLGLLAVNQRNNAQAMVEGSDAESKSVLASELDSGIIFQTSWIFYLSRFFSIRADIMGLWYEGNVPSSGEVKKEVSSQWDAVLGVGFRF
jgi:outer membrane beta-barrel protein